MSAESHFEPLLVTFQLNYSTFVHRITYFPHNRKYFFTRYLFFNLSVTAISAANAHTQHSTSFHTVQKIHPRSSHNWPFLKCPLTGYPTHLTLSRRMAVSSSSDRMDWADLPWSDAQAYRDIYVASRPSTPEHAENQPTRIEQEQNIFILPTPGYPLHSAQLHLFCRTT